MEEIIQFLALVLPVIAISGVVLIFSINIYLKIRRKILLRVNCWFCNQWTKIHYDDRDCFECPTCLQYNGFNSDGGYNRPIPAQYDEMLNQNLALACKTDGLNNIEVQGKAASNGLCHICNNNQRLKVYQLANFIPLNESNYDLEIEHFQKQLEKAYKLCSKCESTVKTTIQKQSRLLGLSFSNLHKKGMDLLDLNSSRNGISRKSKRLFVLKAISITLVCFACLNLIIVLKKLDLSDRNLKRHIASPWSDYVVGVKNSLSVMYANVWEHVLKSAAFNAMLSVYDNALASCQSLVKYLFEVPLIEKGYTYISTTVEKHNGSAYVEYLQPKMENAKLMCFAGVLLQTISSVWKFRNFKVFCLVLWLILGWSHWSYPVKRFMNFYVGILQVFVSVTIIYFTLPTISSGNHKISRLKKLKRISKHSSSRQPKESNQCLGQFSDCEDETIGNSTPKSTVSNIKPVFEGDHSFRFSPNKTNVINTAKESLTNATFTSAKNYNNQHLSDYASDTASIFNMSLNEHNPFDNKKLFDIDVSLNRLHLGAPNIRKSLTPPTNTFHTTKNIPRPKPVISPAKLRNVTQNSWVAGGFWRDANGILLPLSRSNLSRSSSQTSGFASVEPNNYNSLPPSLNNSFCGDYDCNSVFSEPAYCMMSGSGRHFPARGAACHNSAITRTASLYPYHLNHEQLVYIAPCAFNNVFAHQNVSFGQNKFSQRLHKGNIVQQDDFAVPNVGGLNNSFKTYKQGSLLNDIIDKDF